jgi:hypothetical protein
MAVPKTQVRPVFSDRGFFVPGMQYLSAAFLKSKNDPLVILDRKIQSSYIAIGR